jgi:ribosomal protein S27AE
MSDQLEILSPKCPSCGAALEIAPEMDRSACSYCGAKHIVQRKGDAFALELLGDVVVRVAYGADRTSGDPELRSLREKLATLEQERLRFQTHAKEVQARGQRKVVGIFIGGIALCLILFILEMPGFGVLSFMGSMVLPFVVMGFNSVARGRLARQRKEIDKSLNALRVRIDEHRNPS